MSLILPNDFGSTPKKNLILPPNFKSLLLHCCCAPCAGAMLECFRVYDIKPLVFFYNPNIMPKEEYEKRRDELIALCELLDFPYEIGDYKVREFLDLVKSLEKEPERGRRCDLCFTHRLSVSAMRAKELGISHFTTTLATSRWKSKEQVDKAGFTAQDTVGGVQYWAEDWRKGGLVTRRYQLVKEFSFYNQTYCGCIFSKLNTHP